MARLDFKATVEEAKVELAHLQQEMGECLKRQEQLEKKIVALRQTITALSDVLGERFVEEDSLGLTDAVRIAFKTYGQPMAPTDVKDRLEQMGYDTTKYGNLMASVHTIINRLQRQGQIKHTGTIANNKPGYQWVQKLEAPPVHPDVPNPLGKNLAEMLKEPPKEKK